MWTIIARPKPNNGVDTAPFPDQLVKRCLEIGCQREGLFWIPLLELVPP